MISGAEFAKSPNGRERAIGLMREAIAIDPNLWEAHYDLGVLLAQGGDLGRCRAFVGACAEALAQCGGDRDRPGPSAKAAR